MAPAATAIVPFAEGEIANRRGSAFHISTRLDCCRWEGRVDTSIDVNSAQTYAFEQAVDQPRRRASVDFDEAERAMIKYNIGNNLILNVVDYDFWAK